MTTSSWTAADIPDQTGRHIIVTGGNSGIGLEAAGMLARAGAAVTLAVRDVGKGGRRPHCPAKSAYAPSTCPGWSRCGRSPTRRRSRSTCWSTTPG